METKIICSNSNIFQGESVNGIWCDCVWLDFNRVLRICFSLLIFFGLRCCIVTTPNSVFVCGVVFQSVSQSVLLGALIHSVPVHWFDGVCVAKVHSSDDTMVHWIACCVRIAHFFHDSSKGLTCCFVHNLFLIFQFLFSLTLSTLKNCLLFL